MKKVVAATAVGLTLVGIAAAVLLNAPAAKVLTDITYAQGDPRDAGTTQWVEVKTFDDGTVTKTVVPSSPCRCRPHGVTPLGCSKVCVKNPLDGKTPPSPCDSGEDNVMQAGQWVDNGGCVECACAVVFGKERFK